MMREGCCFMKMLMAIHFIVVVWLVVFSVIVTKKLFEIKKILEKK